MERLPAGLLVVARGATSCARCWYQLESCVCPIPERTNVDPIEIAKHIVQSLLPVGSKVDEINVTRLVIDGKVLVGEDD